ncbi:class I SAM-dependent methyltransferase [Candidatus Hydrogenedentota bacterium]
MRDKHVILTMTTALLVIANGCAHHRGVPSNALLTPDPEKFTIEAADKFDVVTRGALAPVYPLLAEQIVSEFELAEKRGIGIDIGSGPGSLIVELCKRTQHMYWINADINTHNFTHFHRNLDKEGLAHRAGAVFADAHALPFRDDYAEIFVSRGTFQFWEDKNQAFAEILRVLKPGGSAFIGRGLPDAMPPEQARAIRGKHGHGPKYDLKETGRELRDVMKNIGVDDYKIRIHKHPGAEDINYGIWVEFRK